MFGWFSDVLEEEDSELLLPHQRPGCFVFHSILWNSFRKGERGEMPKRQTLLSDSPPFRNIQSTSSRVFLSFLLLFPSVCWSPDPLVYSRCRPAFFLSFFSPLYPSPCWCCCCRKSRRRARFFLSSSFHGAQKKRRTPTANMRCWLRAQEREQGIKHASNTDRYQQKRRVINQPKMDDPFSRFDNRLETDTLTTKIQPLSSLSLPIGNYYGPQKWAWNPPAKRSTSHHSVIRKNEGKKNRVLLFFSFIIPLHFYHQDCFLPR